MTTDIEVLFDGEAKGEVLKLGGPICFWGGLDPATGVIADRHHPEHGQCVIGKILTLPAIVGSSSSSQILMETLYRKTAPAAIILGEAEAIIAMAVLVGREMEFGTIPLLKGAIDAFTNGELLTIKLGGRILRQNEG